MNTGKHFVIIDDDKTNNMLCKMMISKNIPEANVIDFTEPEEGINYFRDENSTNNIILFLDINMPLMTGWEFMNAFEALSDNVKNRVSIYMLSSSIAPHDIELANSNPRIKQFFSKPLTKSMVFLVSEKSI